MLEHVGLAGVAVHHGDVGHHGLDDLGTREARFDEGDGVLLAQLLREEEPGLSGSDDDDAHGRLLHEA